MVAPLTTKIKNYYGGIVLDPNPENNLSQTSEILIMHIRSLSTNRFIKKIGNISPEETKKLLL